MVFPPKKSSTRRFIQSLRLFLNINTVEKGKQYLPPLGIDDSDDVIDVDGVLQAKILLWNYLVKEDLTASWLARRADMNRQSVQKIIDFSKSSSFAKVEELLHALGLVAHVTIEKF